MGLDAQRGVHIVRLALVFSLALTACANVERDLTADTSNALLDGSPDAIGLVRFVNDAATTFDILDVDVALDRRAADGLVAGRPFDSVADIDAVPYVGPSALGKLMAYACNSAVPCPSSDLFCSGITLWGEGQCLPLWWMAGFAVDDAVAVAWRDRYIVVVSGWSNTGNVDAVQIYDANADAWHEATSFPGNAVFGHTGALVGDDLIVLDGVRSGIGGFALVNQAWRGRLDAQDPLSIEWSDLGTHPGPPRYRAAGGATLDEIALFHGGTNDPYHFDGRSYGTGQPSPPLSTTLAYDRDEGFVELPHDKPEATMDHRGLARCGGVLLSVGGMTSGPVVTTDVWELRL